MEISGFCASGFVRGERWMEELSDVMVTTNHIAFSFSSSKRQEKQNYPRKDSNPGAIAKSNHSLPLDWAFKL